MCLLHKSVLLSKLDNSHGSVNSPSLTQSSLFGCPLLRQGSEVSELSQNHWERAQMREGHEGMMSLCKQAFTQDVFVVGEGAIQVPFCPFPSEFLTLLPHKRLPSHA